MYLAILIYILGSIFAFFQLNLQFINEAYKDKQIYLIFLTSYPISYAYYYSWTHFVNASGGSAWSARFIFFGLSYAIYPILTYIFLNETPFTLKTILCTILSVAILLIQYKL
jgi:hypothetical protein